MTNKGQRLAMAFDYGIKSIGIATGQELTGMATPLTAIPAQDGVPNWDKLQTLLNEWSPDVLIVGLPLNMDGSEQTITHRAKKFANRLNGRFGIAVETYDERLTTTDAKAQLFEEGGYRNLDKGKIDAVSAQLILESWFSSQY